MAVDSVPPWFPEDDLILKNAVESGASLEALARGAVLFSRRFTFRELQDRWHSLLYDPNISTLASSRMVELEHSASHLAPKFNGFGNSKERSKDNVKRKVGSVRRQYYAMRKRTRCNSTKISFLSGSEPIVYEGGFQEQVTVDKEPAGSCVLGGQILNDFRLQKRGVEKMGLSQALPDIGLPKTDSLEAKTFSPFDLPYNDLGNACYGFGGAQCFDSPASDDGASFHSMGFSSPLPRDGLWKMTEDISAPQMPIHMSLRDKGKGAEDTPTLPDDNACLLNSANEEELLFMDVEAADTVDKTCFDNVNLLLLNSPNNNPEDAVPDLTEPKTSVLDTCLATPTGACSAEVNVIGDQLHTGHFIQHTAHLAEASVTSSSSVPNPLASELSQGIMCCTLNSEDPEIPCNDDILSPKAGPVSGSQIVRPDMLPESGLIYPTVGFVKSEALDANSLARASRHDGNSHNLRLADAASNYTINKQENIGSDKLKELDTTVTLGERFALQAERDFVGMAYPQPTSNPPISDQEELDSDDDLPSFSDVEAMILEMDLCPHDQDYSVSMEASRYQHTESKRTILRLEQCARSSLQRAIASHGALAILYSDHSKHYIKKAEVILGRATGDNEVDVDLRREGRSSKISRRQATIKMDRDGSFLLRNLGKSLIFVNGKEVARGQLIGLNSSCLIEIRDIRLVFEVNHNSVRRFLAKSGKYIQEKNTSFKWSPEELYE